MAEDLSAKQRSIIEFLREFIEEKDYPPSIRDIQHGCDISSTSVVDYNLKRLEEKGYIRRDREVSRAIELTSAGGRRARAVRVPVVGKIAAGSPIPTPPESMTLDAFDEYVEVTDGQTGGRNNVFALRVEGDSMIGAVMEATGVRSRFPLDKLLRQARSTSRAAAEQALREIEVSDHSVKTGQTDDVLALELLVMRLSTLAGRPGAVR